MNKPLLIFLLGAASAVSAAAQCKITPDGMNLIQQWRMQRESVTDPFQKQTLDAQGAQSYGAIISLAEGANFEVLAQLGIEPTTVVTDNLIVAEIPLDKMDAVAALPEVTCIQFGGEQKPLMNYARTSGNVEQVQNGFTYKGATHSFDGSGVVAGLVDAGIDPNHANFRDDNGNLRVARVWHFSGTSGTYRTYATPSAIASFSTDIASMTHGTHVAGIMAGSYDGTGKWVSQSSPDSPAGLKIENNTIPFKGVATGATIAMAGAPSLTDNNVIGGVTQIVQFAESQNMPCVVNMSLGSNIGPHDGTDPYSQALTALGKRAIICMSAGNEGDMNMSIARTLTSSNRTLTTFIKDNTAEDAVVDIWSATDQPLTVSWVIYDTSSKSYTTLVSMGSSSNGNFEFVGNSSSYTQNSVFNSAFTGFVALSANLATYNNRFNVYARLNVKPKTGNSTKLLGLKVEGVSGQKVYVYGVNCEFTNLRSVSGSVAGTPANSINASAAAANVITVGSYNSRLYYGILRSGYYGYYPEDYTYNDISPFSSYGETIQGIYKPDLCAPGCGIVSSISTPYFNASGATESNMSASATVYNRNNYWMNMQGTSMSCPFVSGVVALWLQADNNLGYSDVMDVINATSVKDRYVTDGGNAERWGAGKVDALAGIKYILDRKAAIGAVVADEPEKMVFVSPTANGYDITVAGASEVNATLYSVSGVVAARVNASGSNAVISTAGLQSGVYVLSVDTPAGRHTTKLAVK